MNERQKRLNEVYEHLRRYFGIHTKTGFAEAIHYGRTSLSAAMNGDESYLTDNLFKNICEAYPYVFNIDYLLNGSGQLLTIQEEKEELLVTSGADFVAFLPFTRELAQLSAHEFMQQVLKEQLQVKVLVIGYDHRFGHNRDEGFEDYVRYGKELGIEVVQAKELDCGKHVSSSTIRKALAQGDVAVAQDYLGYPYFLEGEVVEAFHIGRKIGFPTANIHVSHDKLIPQNGVYAVSVRLEDGTEAYGMLNIGSRPTLDNGSHVSIEVHIFHFHENIYGKHLRISFLKYIRKEQKFDSLEELQAQLERDKEECEKLRMKN